MPKTKISEFSSTPANNTDIDSINIAENCPPSGINDAIRELMSQLKDWQSGTSNDPMVIGSSGSLTLNQGTANGVTYLNGSKVVTSGSALVFDGTRLTTTAFTVADGANGTARFGSDSTYNITGGVDNGGFRFNLPSGVDYQFRFASSDAMRLTSTGLGIGTSSPASLWSGAYQLVVGSGSGGAGATIYTSNSTTGTLAFADGTAGDAAYRGYVQYAHTTDSLVLGTGGTTKATIDSSGNLGLGVTPSAWASNRKAIQFGSIGCVYSDNNVTSEIGANVYISTAPAYTYITSNFASRYAQINGIHQWHTAPSGTAGNPITFTQAMTLDASGRLGVGTTSPLTPLQINSFGGFDGNGNQFYLTNNQYYDSVDARDESIKAGYSNRIVLDNNSGGILFQTTSTSAAGANTAITLAERARIDSSGNLLVGTTTAQAKLTTVTTGNAVAGFFKNDASGYQTITVQNAGASGTRYLEWFVAGTTDVGSISSNGTITTYNTTSDYRLKINQAPLTESGAFIDSLKPKTWTWVQDNSKGVGFIAHEFAEVSPSSVSGEKDAVDENGNPVYQSMQASSAEVIANLVAEIQSLRKRLADANL